MCQDAVRVSIPIEDILQSMPEKFHASARETYANFPPEIDVRSLRKIIPQMLDNPSLNNHFQYAAKESKDPVTQDRVYEEPFSANYARDLQNKLPPGSSAILMTFASDAALPTKLAKKSFHPLIFDMGKNAIAIHENSHNFRKYKQSL